MLAFWPSITHPLRLILLLLVQLKAKAAQLSLGQPWTWPLGQPWTMDLARSPFDWTLVELYWRPCYMSRCCAGGCSGARVELVTEASSAHVLLRRKAAIQTSRSTRNHVNSFNSGVECTDGWTDQQTVQVAQEGVSLRFSGVVQAQRRSSDSTQVNDVGPVPLVDQVGNSVHQPVGLVGWAAEAAVLPCCRAALQNGVEVVGVALAAAVPAGWMAKASH